MVLLWVCSHSRRAGYLICEGIIYLGATMKVIKLDDAKGEKRIKLENSRDAIFIIVIFLGITA
ncbi:hypothetical protein B4901_11615 [Yersinia frederiksenii]|nr:hypothetical protein B4901_11615 [Yersinia frederiksenii]